MERVFFFDKQRNSIISQFEYCYSCGALIEKITSNVACIDKLNYVSRFPSDCTPPSRLVRSLQEWVLGGESVTGRELERAKTGSAVCGLPHRFAVWGTPPWRPPQTGRGYSTGPCQTSYARPVTTAEYPRWQVSAGANRTMSSLQQMKQGYKLITSYISEDQRHQQIFRSTSLNIFADIS